MKADNLRALLPGGSDRVENTIPHLQEVFNRKMPDGIIVQFIYRDPSETSQSILGDVRQKDLAYLAAWMLHQAVEERS